MEGYSEIAPQALADDGCTAPGWLRIKEEALPFSVVLQTSLPSGWREKLSFSKTRRE